MVRKQKVVVSVTLNVPSTVNSVITCKTTLFMESTCCISEAKKMSKKKINYVYSNSILSLLIRKQRRVETYHSEV